MFQQVVYVGYLLKIKEPVCAKRSGRNLPGNFKAKLALEAIHSIKTFNEIAQE
jgi:hypothetical protein